MIFDIGYRAIERGEQAPDGSQLRPHIVWFGEPLTMFEAAKCIGYRIQATERPLLSDPVCRKSEASQSACFAELPDRGLLSGDRRYVIKMFMSVGFGL